MIPALRCALVCSLVMLTMARNSSAIAPVAGFRISGRKVLDARNNEFIMRGVNHAHTWYESQLTTALPSIAATGSNCVRVVLSNGKHAENWGKNSASDVADVIRLCKQNKLIAVLEVHDCTGYPEKQGSAQLSTAVDYWIELKNELIGQEGYIIINIANEPFGNNVTASTWIDEHKNAIKRLRENGFKHMLIVDAANWGQDWEKIMQANAQEVFDSDPDRNILFSIHMYDVYGDANTVSSYLQSFVDKNLPLIVGEFAADHGSSDKNVDEETILQKCKEYGIGYIGWSWKGNSTGLTSLDIALQWNGSSLSSWGNTLINSADGIKATSRIATIFTTDVPSASMRTLKKFNHSVSRLPAGWSITLQTETSSRLQITLFDMTGGTVYSRNLVTAPDCRHSVNISSTRLPAGVYLMKIADAAGAVTVPLELH
ncbi:MAG: cellulase family glycosylhydrolase [Chitinispirillaceae bacterium]|nr:cellulase family glycosylhydrolase [Chitinispirillaceae bacterium]